ncbi:hypothetical protein N431DRAFT_438382 [Stipitochalara longipes BDJ]|nr:hypothetical protein N431DRAFT_438382 [Stipitochalara longipes BDJ]
MDEPLRITNPALLTDITTGVSSLNISSDTQPPPTTLVLLQPLGNPSRYGTWLPSSIFSRHLSLQSLSLRWRQAVTRVAPISHLIFDLSLPRPESHEEFQKVYWDTSVPEEGGIAVRTRDVMTLVITIATETRMRVKGAVRFEVRYGEGEGVSERAMGLLQKQLGELEKDYKRNGKVPDEDAAGREGDTKNVVVY